MRRAIPSVRRRRQRKVRRGREGRRNNVGNSASFRGSHREEGRALEGGGVAEGRRKARGGGDGGWDGRSWEEGERRVHRRTGRSRAEVLIYILFVLCLSSVVNRWK